jgi:peptidoglycan lytic transglycosylase G
VSSIDDDDLEPPNWVDTARQSRRPRTAAPRQTAMPPRYRPGDAAGDGEGVDWDSGHDEDDLEPEVPRGQRAAQRVAARKDRRRRRRRTLVVLAIVLLPIVLVAAFAGWFIYQLNPPGDAGRKISVTIPADTGNDAIGELLEDKGVIGSSTAFSIFTKFTRAGPFKPGRYSLREDMGVRDAVNTLKRGPANGPEFRLDLPPALTLDQIADRVGRLPGHTKEGFLAAAQSGVVRSRYQPPEVTSLEGLLYPDTYFIAKDETDEQILARFVSAFDQQADAIGLSTANTSGLGPYQTIIAASLIEREAKLDEDRPLISAVIRNRLLSGMLLQIDATVCYAKGGCETAPTKADLEIDSPYNTYRVQGLPPTPISSVSAQSLAAAAKPADVPYLFYVLSDKDGRHKYATTEEEHNRNVEEARQKGLL